MMLSWSQNNYIRVQCSVVKRSLFEHKSSKHNTALLMHLFKQLGDRLFGANSLPPWTTLTYCNVYCTVVNKRYGNLNQNAENLFKGNAIENAACKMFTPICWQLKRYDSSWPFRMASFGQKLTKNCRQSQKLWRRYVSPYNQHCACWWPSTVISWDICHRVNII